LSARGFSHSHQRLLVIHASGRKRHLWPRFPAARPFSYARRSEGGCREKHVAAFMNPFNREARLKPDPTGIYGTSDDHRLKPVAKRRSQIRPRIVAAKSHVFHNLFLFAAREYVMELANQNAKPREGKGGDNSDLVRPKLCFCRLAKNRTQG